jgi:hypothetical protein
LGIRLAPVPARKVGAAGQPLVTQRGVDDDRVAGPALAIVSRTEGTTIDASPRFLKAPIRSTTSWASISGWSASATITASSFGDSACRPMRSDDGWPSSGRGLRASVIGNAFTAASIASAWWPSTTTTSSTPAPDSAISWRRTSGTPPSSSSAFGRPPRRDPAPAASSTAPTDIRL